MCHCVSVIVIFPDRPQLEMVKYNNQYDLHPCHPVTYHTYGKVGWSDLVIVGSQQSWADLFNMIVVSNILEKLLTLSIIKFSNEILNNSREEKMFENAEKESGWNWIASKGTLLAIQYWIHFNKCKFQSFNQNISSTKRIFLWLPMMKCRWGKVVLAGRRDSNKVVLGN